VREPVHRPRNVELERQLTDMAVQTLEGITNDGGLSDFADRRALPGGVRIAMDWRREAMEELADCRNYLAWGGETFWDGYQAGDPEAGKQVAQGLTALAAVVRAWHALV